MSCKKIIKLIGIFSICVAVLMGSKIMSRADGLDKEKKINKLVYIAETELGYKEAENGWTKYGQWWTDRTGDSAYATASWSCMFLSWCGKEAGFTEEEYGFFSYTGYWISWFENKNAYYSPDDYKARRGDIVFLDNNGDGTVDTAGLVEDNIWNRIIVIKGNVGGKTVREKFKESDAAIIGYGSFYDEKQENQQVDEIGKPKLGIDVSEFNGDIDWQQVKSSGVEFVYIRVGYRGYGQAGTLVTDRKFTQNIEGATAAGIDVGIYFVTQAITTDEAVEEANFVIDKIKNYNITYPVAIDTEQASVDERSKNLTRDERTAIITDSYNRVEQVGYKGQIYSGKWWFSDKLNMDQLDGYDIWVAEYTYNQEGSTSFQHPYSVWQYSDKGRVLGISSDVDMNLCYTNYVNSNKKSDMFGWLKDYFK